MKAKSSKILDLVVIGTGLSGLNFIDTYLEKNKNVNVISPNINKLIKKKIITECYPRKWQAKRF